MRDPAGCGRCDLRHRLSSPSTGPGCASILCSSPSSSRVWGWLARVPGPRGPSRSHGGRVPAPPNGAGRRPARAGGCARPDLRGGCGAGGAAGGRGVRAGGLAAWPCWRRRRLVAGCSQVVERLALAASAAGGGRRAGASGADVLFPGDSPLAGHNLPRQAGDRNCPHFAARRRTAARRRQFRARTGRFRSTPRGPDPALARGVGAREPSLPGCGLATPTPDTATRLRPPPLRPNTRHPRHPPAATPHPTPATRDPQLIPDTRHPRHPPAATPHPTPATRHPPADTPTPAIPGTRQPPSPAPASLDPHAPRPQETW